MPNQTSLHLLVSHLKSTHGLTSNSVNVSIVTVTINHHCWQSYRSMDRWFHFFPYLWENKERITEVKKRKKQSYVCI